VAVANARFSTEAVFLNAGRAPLTLGFSGGQVTLPPGEQRFIPDFLVYSGIGEQASSVPVDVLNGAPASLLAGARTYSTAPNGGSYGLFYPVVSVEEGATTEAWVFGLRQDGDARSNLAVANTSSGAAPNCCFPQYLSADVFDGETGLLAGSVALVPQGVPFVWNQVNSILSRFGIRNGYARIRADVGPFPPFFAYGVVNDGASPGLGTSDGSYVPMIKPLPPSPFPQ